MDCLDAGVSGVQDIARLALQHRGGSELRGAAGKGPRLHSVHRGLPGSASEVGRSRQIPGEHGQTVLIYLRSFLKQQQQQQQQLS
ncbi:hypothetical protein E3U43_022485 [Larimichthys crocea]|uniref:Uncharacterized protein n=1 Tax=Larimichthys crocea TaxID=215358 RepID=A0ACD3R3N7_LARCR|nr:hypothetical protein E3U43_022485 [Larimichthys crocea]